jgi:hypothetical protein
MRRRSCTLLSLLLFTGAVHAAELGDARVSSHIGQQLVADIELSAIDDPSTPVSVRVASPEVYSGAGITMPPVLASLNLSVVRRDGRQFLHVTSLRPVDADHLHLYLELTDRGQRAVRLATLWLTPDPNPAPPPAPVPVPAPAPPPAPAPFAPPVPARGATAAALPSVQAPAPLSVPMPRSRPAPAAPVHKPAAIHADSPPAACVRQPDEAQACTALGVKNTALREQLGKLEDKVKGLQAIVLAPVAPGPALPPPAPDAHKSGQATADAHASSPARAKAPAVAAIPEPAEAAPPARSASPLPVGIEPLKPADPKPVDPKPVGPKPVGPKPISSIKPLVPLKPKTPPPEEGGAPWGWIAAIVAGLATVGGGTWLVLKRRARSAGGPAGAGVLDKLKRRFAARTKAPAPVATAAEKVAEPTME